MILIYLVISLFNYLEMQYYKKYLSFQTINKTILHSLSFDFLSLRFIKTKYTMGKIKRNKRKGWEVIKKEKTARVRRTDKQLAAAVVKDLKSVAILKMIEMIPEDKRPEFIGLFKDIRINQSEVQKVAWIMIANAGFARGKTIKES